MILVKKTYLIRLIDDNRGKKVNLTIRFFDLKDGVVHTTEKTEIEVDDEVYIFSYLQPILFIDISINRKYNIFNILVKFHKLDKIFQNTFEVEDRDWESKLYTRIYDFVDLMYLERNSRLSVIGTVNAVSLNYIYLLKIIQL